MSQFILEQEYQVLITDIKQPSQLPWGHIIVLMQQVKDPKARDWYAENALKNGIARSVLSIQIEQNLYERQGKHAHNKPIAEYSLKRTDGAIGIAEYRLSPALPKELQESLPDFSLLEAKLADKMKEEILL